MTLQRKLNCFRKVVWYPGSFNSLRIVIMIAKSSVFPYMSFCILLSYSSLSKWCVILALYTSMSKEVYWRMKSRVHHIMALTNFLSLLSNDAWMSQQSFTSHFSHRNCSVYLTYKVLASCADGNLLRGRMYTYSKPCLSQCSHAYGFSFMHGHELELRVDRYILGKRSLVGL